MFGDCIGRIGRYARNGQAQLFGSRDIDLIEAGAAQRNEPHAHLHQFFQHGPRQIIVDEGTDRDSALGQCHRFKRQPCFAILHPHAGPCGRVKELPVIGFGAIDDDPHLLLRYRVRKLP